MNEIRRLLVKLEALRVALEAAETRIALLEQDRSEWKIGDWIEDPVTGDRHCVSSTGSKIMLISETGYEWEPPAQWLRTSRMPA